MRNEEYENISKNELVVGLIGPIGSDFDEIYDFLQKSSKNCGYECKLIHVSNMFSKWDKEWDKFPENLKKKIKRIIKTPKRSLNLNEKIDRGNKVARIEKNIIGNRISFEIAKLKNDSKDRKKLIFVVRSIKRDNEINYLRRVYGRAFFTLGVFGYKETLIKTLQTQENLTKCEAETLYERDSKEDDHCGQQIERIFPRADYFVFDQNNKEHQKDVERFINLVLGHPFTLPTIEEVGMAYAFLASLRSSDSSRQVGASILNNASDVLTTGYNEVPKFGGGLYQDTDPHPQRNFEQKILPNKVKINRIATKIINDVFKKKVSDAILKKVEKTLSDEGIVEFTRCVHAEQNAINTAARIGALIRGTTLYVTTFPCHICMPSIIDSGIVKVVYLHPYPKSNAFDLHSDAIELQDQHGQEVNKVLCKPFEGLNPARYFELFHADSTERKKNTHSYKPKLEREVAGEKSKEKGLK